MHDRVEDRDLLHRAGLSGNFNEIADADRSKDKQHNASGEVRQRTLQGEADRQTGRSKDGDQRRRLYSKEVEHRDQDDAQNQVVDHAREERDQGDIGARFRQNLCQSTARPAGNDPSNNQEHDCTDHDGRSKIALRQAQRCCDCSNSSHGKHGTSEVRHPTLAAGQ